MDRLLQIPGFIPSNIERYPNYWVKGAALFCLVPAAELALRSLASLVEPKKQDGSSISLAERSWNVLTNVAGATFYGLCALNFVPYSAVGGAVLFTAYSILQGGYKDSCYSSQLICNLWQGSVGPSFNAAREWVVSYYPTGPAADTVSNFAKVIFSREAMHLVGIGVTAVFAYRVAPLLF